MNDITNLNILARMRAMANLNLANTLTFGTKAQKDTASIALESEAQRLLSDPDFIAEKTNPVVPEE